MLVHSRLKVPQFILDDAYEKRKSVNIIVTQPRRIAAISIANRVTRERELPKELPHLIGYQVKEILIYFDSKRPSSQLWISITLITHIDMRPKPFGFIVAHP